MILRSPPQFGQCSMSISNTRLSRPAQANRGLVGAPSLGEWLSMEVDASGGRVAHCASMPACLITLRHFANSCAMKAPNGAVV